MNILDSALQLLSKKRPVETNTTESTNQCENFQKPTTPDTEPLKLPDSISHPYKDFTSCVEKLETFDSTFTDIAKFYLPKLPASLSLAELKEIIRIIPDFPTDKDYLTEGMKSLGILEAIPPHLHQQHDLSTMFPPEVYSYYSVVNQKAINPTIAYKAMQFYASERFKTTLELKEGNTHIDNKMVSVLINPDLKNPSQFFPSLNMLSRKQWEQLSEINSNMKNHIPAFVPELDAINSKKNIDPSRTKESKLHRKGRKI